MQEWTVNDMRLIDADELKEMLIKERNAMPLTKTDRYGFGVKVPNHHGMSMRGGINKAFRCMEQTHTIDAVPVVRCKDCKRCDGFPEPDDIQPNEIGICRINMLAVKPEGFCSYGERKDGEA